MSKESWLGAKKRYNLSEEEERVYLLGYVRGQVELITELREQAAKQMFSKSPGKTT